MFRYDFDTRNDYLGSHHTFLVEHSNPAFGSDFNWTRFQAHLRYAYPLGEHQIRTRVVVGSATAPLPIQRQFVMGGIGTLNGYPLYAFAGDAGLLFNVEFLYHLFSFGDQSLSAALILDEGQVWNISESQRRFDPKGSVGIGLQFETDVDIFRFNVAKAFDAEQGVQYNFMFFYSF
jgi:outer membrane protein assembly factor BamA